MKDLKRNKACTLTLSILPSIQVAPSCCAISQNVTTGGKRYGTAGSCCDIFSWIQRDFSQPHHPLLRNVPVDVEFVYVPSMQDCLEHPEQVSGLLEGSAPLEWVPETQMQE